MPNAMAPAMRHGARHKTLGNITLTQARATAQPCQPQPRQQRPILSECTAMPDKPANELQRGDIVLATDTGWPSPVYARVTGTSAGHFRDLVPPELRQWAIQDAAVVVHVEYETPVRIGEGRDDVTKFGNIYHRPTDQVKFRKGNT